MKKDTGTIFKLYLLAESHSEKQEGVIQLWKHRGVLQGDKGVHFDHWDELPRKMRKLLSVSDIDWRADGAGRKGRSVVKKK